jgi:ABC-type multidrug transport system ATPase subunit
MLEAHGLIKRYGTTTALNGFDLTVAAGEIVGLVGHNGAGKTTFVEIVTGLVKPDAGTVRVGGRTGRSARALIGVAPQELALYPNATVRDGLRLFGELAGVRGAALRAAIDRVAGELRLTEVLDRRTGVLSGGQRRRAQAALALVGAPALLLLDEPTAGADPETRTALLTAVRGRADEGTAVVYATHYLPELTELDATLAVVRRGRVIARGRQADLMAGLPGELRLSFDGAAPTLPCELLDRSRSQDGELRVMSTAPTVDLAAILAVGGVPVAVDVRRPGIDDLYRSLAVSDVA